MWKWIWPYVGPTPVSEGLDSEMFDRADYPYSDTFVREAIQNSLDARRNPAAPVVISFRFHKAALGVRKNFLQDVFHFRETAGLSVPDGWKKNLIEWITIEDFNTRGLAGSLTNRMSDFWNYWLNFGISNKDGRGRGGRGIGRVTFLITSQVRTVFGLTKRSSDGTMAACAMCVLKAYEEGNDLHSTHAYLASKTNNSIYDLYNSAAFYSEMTQAFEFQGYQEPDASGLALAIPYPHEDLKPEGILASAIEHFAPAIMNRTLIVKVDGEILNQDTIEKVAEKVSSQIRTEALREDIGRYLRLIGRGLANELDVVSVADLKVGLRDHKTTPLVKKLQASIDRSETVGLRIELPLEHDGKTKTVSLKVVAAKIPTGKQAIDRLFREGMSLPDVKAKNPGELDAIILVDDIALATYLNFCEGKAHLDLLESKEIRAKLEEKKYGSGYTIKRFIKKLPEEFRNVLTPDITEPDACIFDGFFSVPTDQKGLEPGKTPGPKNPPPTPPVPVQFRVPVLDIETLKNGFRAKANPQYKKWPVNISITMAYANGSRSPGWSEYDFDLDDLEISYEDCEVTHANNRLQAKKCGPNCRIEVAGFDSRRELDTRIRVMKDAQTD